MMKRLNRLFPLRAKSGFTLAELIITSALLGILIIGIMAFMAPALRSLNSAKSDAGALNTATTIEHYLSRALRNSTYVAIFSDAAFSDFTGAVTNTTIRDTLDELYGKINGSTSYTLNCISIRYGYDEKTQTHKYMLCTEKIGSGGYKLDSTANASNEALGEDYLVFEKCFYDGLYVDVGLVQPVAADNPATLRHALKIDVNVYSDDKMTKDTLMVQGSGFTEMNNIKTAKTDTSLGLDYTFYMDTSSMTDADPDNNCGAPFSIGTGKDTFIFYVDRYIE